MSPISRTIDHTDLDTIVGLAKRRGFVFQASEIYGGLGSTWDYGPLGAELKRNVKDMWWKSMVRDRDDIVGMDSAILQSPEVWMASGHVENFSDPLVECGSCHRRYRGDEVGEVCPHCGASEFSEPRQFNLLFKTFMGPVEDDAAVVYLRPETAQGIFINFNNVQTTTRKRIPFGIAQIGKSFRNEVTPGNFIFRPREFEQMGMEFFFKP
ncbi:MAG: glycine--tRNA ligase, partial [Chloroflexi bacterium]|nr:glycine--tRNA ligase [Chloroflexota bacterium]